MAKIDKSEMIPIERLQFDDPIEMDEIKRLGQEVRRHLHHYPWCKRIKNIWFAEGFSKVAVFFVEIDSIDYDEQLWVVVGDLPPAHLVVDDIPDAKEALFSYAAHMRDWVLAVRSGQSTKACIPVSAAPTLENADLLERRLDFIEKDYLPNI